MVCNVIFIFFFARTDTLDIMDCFQLLGNKRRGWGWGVSHLGWQRNPGTFNSSLFSPGTAWYISPFRGPERF